MINIMIGYDSHASTFAVEHDVAKRLVLMDNIDAINDYITSEGHYVTSAREARMANTFLDMSERDNLEVFHSDLVEELSTSV